MLVRECWGLFFFFIEDWFMYQDGCSSMRSVVYNYMLSLNNPLYCFILKFGCFGSIVSWMHRMSGLAFDITSCSSCFMFEIPWIFLCIIFLRVLTTCFYIFTLLPPNIIGGEGGLLFFCKVLYPRIFSVKLGSFSSQDSRNGYSFPAIIRFSLLSGKLVKKLIRRKTVKIFPLVSIETHLIKSHGVT